MRSTKANTRLVEYLLRNRTIADWLPDADDESTLADWRDQVWDYLVGSFFDDLQDGQDPEGRLLKRKMLVEQYITWIYDLVGDKCIDDIINNTGSSGDGNVNVNDILDASPTLERNIVSFWERCQDAAAANAADDGGDKGINTTSKS